MERFKGEKQHQFSRARSLSLCSDRNVWDCGSTLYDSYELNSFKSQLDSAIANSPRTLSMSHLPEPHHLHHPQPHKPPPSSHALFSKSFKFSRPFQKLLRFVFKSSSNKPKITNNSSFHQFADKYSKERYYVVYDKSDQPVLSTIPELPEFEIGGLSPEISSLVRKSASERFTAATSIGISCA